MQRFWQTALQQIGQTKKVLALKEQTGSVKKLLSRDYWQCWLEEDQDVLRNKEFEVRITDCHKIAGNMLLKAKPIKSSLLEVS